VAQKVLTGITMPLDGYVTCQNDRIRCESSDVGKWLHRWDIRRPTELQTPPVGSAIGPNKDIREGNGCI
jgi:hypothetical protein